MTARAYVREDMIRRGVQIVVSPDEHEIIRWGTPTVIRETDPAAQAPDDSILRLQEPLARALYEALAEHFGGSALNSTTLRKDYDDERARVDKMINTLAVIASNS